MASTRASPQRTVRSLSRLNDNCLLAICQYISISDLCAFRKTCSRFRKIADRDFSANYKSFNLHEGHTTKSAGCHSKKYIRRVCRSFGHLIVTMSVWLYRIAPDFDRLMVYLDRHCHQLVNLTIIDYSFIHPIDIERINRVFGRLQKLDIRGVPSEFFLRHCTSLKEFKFTLPTSDAYRTGAESLARIYPSLESIEINNIPNICYNLLHGLIKNSPRLKTLKILDCDLFNVKEKPEAIAKIATLDFCFIEFGFNHENNNLVHLLKSMAVKRLDLKVVHWSFAEVLPFFKELIVLNSTVACFHLDIFCGQWTDEAVTAVCQLRTLRTLKMESVHAVHADDIDVIMSLIRRHPSLEELHFTIYNETFFKNLLVLVGRAGAFNIAIVIECDYNLISKA